MESITAVDAYEAMLEQHKRLGEKVAGPAAGRFAARGEPRDERRRQAPRSLRLPGVVIA